MSDRLLEHLASLVACDTQNPPRNIDRGHRIFAHLSEVLSDFDIAVDDYGDGHVNFHAVRGRPRVLFNVHLDTVPCGSGWPADPLQLRIANGRAHGRGACDIKGAAAALLALAQQSDAPMALLFSTDEEGAGGCCVRNFCAEHADAGFDAVIVAEPTACRAIAEHRGYLSVVGRFQGCAGHSSEARALTDNAIHRFAQWASAALARVGREQAGERSCFNIGRIEGGIKSNVIADVLEVRWSARLPGGTSNEAFFEELASFAPADVVSWECPFIGPPLPALPAPAADPGGSQAIIERFGLRSGSPVDFWTEASIFSESGFAAVVLGPGNIAQAHAVDEWVALDQLREIEQIYRGIIEHG